VFKVFWSFLVTFSDGCSRKSPELLAVFRSTHFHRQISLNSPHFLIQQVQTPRISSPLVHFLHIFITSHVASLSIAQRHSDKASPLFWRLIIASINIFFLILGRKPRATQKAATAASPKKIPSSLTLFVTDDD
jgi:small-conductance mechanosensitive channel